MSAISIPCPACGQGLKIRDRSLLGRRAKCPKCSHSFVLEEPAEVELHLAGSPNPAGWAPQQPPVPQATATAPAAPFAPMPGIPVPGVPVATTPAASRLHARKARKGYGGLIIGLGVLLFAAGGGYLFYTGQLQTSPGLPGNRSQAAAPETSSPGNDLSAIPAGITSSPTSGKPILLEMVPAGARTLLHLRPAELWAAGSRGEEFRYCLGPLGVFIDQQIQAICKRPPAEIEELLFAWIPGPRGTAPELATVVRLKQDAKKSELLDILGGMMVETYGRPVYVNGDRAGVILDLKTFAIGPASMAEDLVISIGGQSPMPAGIDSLIQQSDAQRHITLIFEPTATLLDLDFMAPEAARPFLTQCMDWFGNDVETVMWSMHLEPDRFFSDLQMRNTTSVGTVALEDKLRKEVNQLPETILEAVRLMQPGMMGQRKIIARFPAMLKVAAMSTIAEHGPRHVRLITAMPDRAAPNLALGSLLAWDESTRTDFNRVRSTAPSPGPSSNLPTSIAERLKLKIDVEYRRTPLQEAFAQIAEGAKVEIDIEGDALKLAGYTQNMPQTFKLDQVTGTQAIYEITKQYDKMCIVVDETSNKITVMTYQFAEQKGLKPFPLTP